MIKITTITGSEYTIDEVTCTWARTKTTSESGHNNIDFRGTCDDPINIRIGKKLTLERSDGSYTDKYNPKIVITSKVIKIELLDPTP